MIRGPHFTPECKVGDPEQKRAEPCWTIQDPELYGTPSTPWLQLLCPVSCGLTCVSARVCMSASSVPGLFDRSCPYLHARLRGEADLSREAASKREGTGLRWHRVPGRPARLLLPRALGAGELGWRGRERCVWCRR